MPTADEMLEAINGSVAAIAANAAAVDAEGKFPDDNLDILADTGAFGLVASPEHGGAGGSLTHLARACELIGGACASTGMVFLMHSVTVATLQGGGGPAAQAAVKDIVETRALGTLAFSERGTGAHFYAPELKAEKNDDGSVSVSGRKTFVTSGGHADYYLILVQSEEGADTYLLRRSDPGLTWDGSWWGLGMAGNSSIAMNLDNVQFPLEQRVGAPGKGGELVFGVVAPWFLVGLASVSVGIARAASSAAGEHIKSRKYDSGGSLAEVQYIQHLVADMDMATSKARLLVRHAAALGDAGDPGALVPIMQAKVSATEAAQEVTGLAMTATGGQGYTPALPVERHFRDARAGAVMAPTNAVLRTWIGKALTGLPVP
ncbi:MAG TPA: acyl-CoA dehydrogenase family protein [Actinomycetota bacterium]|nr:acyl-CoA dehydrogenase family protein [Actinomycetota bacterium]